MIDILLGTIGTVLALTLDTAPIAPLMRPVVLAGVALLPASLAAIVRGRPIFERRGALFALAPVGAVMFARALAGGWHLGPNAAGLAAACASLTLIAFAARCAP